MGTPATAYCGSDGTRTGKATTADGLYLKQLDLEPLAEAARGGERQGAVARTPRPIRLRLADADYQAAVEMGRRRLVVSHALRRHHEIERRSEGALCLAEQVLIAVRENGEPIAVST